MIQIWGKPQCPYCDAAKQFCEQNNYAYEYRQLDIDFTREEVLEHFPEARTFPQIVVNGSKIGGWDQLKIYVEETGYNGTGYTL
jgi:glutaredoxin 3